MAKGPSSQPAGAPSGSPKIVLLVGVVCLLAVGLAIAAALGSGDGDRDDAAATTTAPPTTGAPPGSTPPTFAEGTPVDVPLVAPGESITGETPCPAEDGSSPRVSLFESAPPMCIDPEKEYRATIRTDQGDLVLLLDPQRGARSVNNFVVLSRYHYYDGMAVNGAKARSHVQFGGAIEGYQDTDYPGYSIPDESVETVYVAGTIGFVPRDDGSSGAEFFITTYDEAADLPVLTTFGMMLDGADTLNALDRLGTESGQPSGVITIESIDIEQIDLDA